MRSSGVVDTFKTLSRGSVTISNSILVHISVAVACLAQLNSAVDSRGVSKVSVGAGLTPGSEVPHWTLQADDGIVWHLHTGSSVGTGTPLAVVGSAAQGVSVVPSTALVACVSARVVLTDASPGLRVADFRVFVTVAGNAGHEGTPKGGTVSEPRGTGFAELTQISLWTGALLDPRRRSSRCSSVRRLQLHVVQIRLSSVRIRGSDFDGCQVAQNGHEPPG